MRDNNEATFTILHKCYSIATSAKGMEILLHAMRHLRTGK
jgi:hypothetical protein